MIIVGNNLLHSQQLVELCAESFAQAVIVTDENVNELYGVPLQKYLSAKNIKANVIVVPAGEQSKSREMKAYVTDQMFEFGCGRDTCVLALGGGVITDLAGFVAATFCRGVPAIYLPTTLLAMVDAAIGGKTGINLPYGKNLLGTFTQPKAVLSDINTLSTLSEKDYVGAFAEIIKHAVINDAEYFSLLMTNSEKLRARDAILLMQVIERSVEIKNAIVAQDEREQSGVRESLNFGHTVGHALERLSNYELQHGYAVAIGMTVESTIANRIGLLDSDSLQTIKKVIGAFGLLQFFDRNIPVQSVVNAMRYDKKNRNDQTRFVLPQTIGCVKTVQAVDDNIIKAALVEVMQ